MWNGFDTPLSTMVPCTSVPVMFASRILLSWTYVTKSDTDKLVGVGPRPVLTAMYTRTTAQMAGDSSWRIHAPQR